MNHICGCYAWHDHRRHYLPQVELSSHTLITPLFFTTKLTQTFSNNFSVPTSETRYTFPLYDGVSVSSFTCTIGDRIITGHVEEKEQARQTYNDAVQRGETAGLLESLPSGIFAVTLGNVPAKTNVIVNITYGGELKHDAEIDGLRYTLPTSIAPRYGQYPGELVGNLNASAGNGIRITVDFNMGQSSIRKIQSPSKDHPIALSIGNCADEPSTAMSDPSKASVTLALGTAELSTDFVLQILVDDISTPKAILAKHPTLPGQKAIMATLVPKFKLDSISPEIVFIADQSGSMSGGKNRALVSTLRIFLKSLPVGVRFNVCAFGSHYKFLWEQSQPYTKDNLSKAVKFVEDFSAQYGGTEMFEPVAAAFKNHFADLPLELFLLTDGEIWREAELIEFINSKIRDDKVDVRIFTLGIGNDVSHTLVESVARAGNGFSQFVTEAEPMDKKVLRMLKAALYPHISDCTLEIGYAEAGDDFEMVDENVEAKQSPSPGSALNKSAPIETIDSTSDKTAEKAPVSLFDESADVDAPPTDVLLPNIEIPTPLQAPNKLPALLPWTRTTAYLLLEDTARVPEKLIFRATCSQGPLELTIPIKALDKSTTTVHTLAARAAIYELEEGRGWLYDVTIAGESARTKHASCFEQLVEREGVRLSVKYQVASKWASFVAVENGAVRSEKEATVGTEEVSPSGFASSFETTQALRLPPRGNFCAQPAPNSNVRRRVGSNSALFGGPSLMMNSEMGFGPSYNRSIVQEAPMQQSQASFALPPDAKMRYGRPSMSKKKRSAGNPFNNAGFEPAESTLDPELAKIRNIIALQDFDGYWEADNLDLYELLGFDKKVQEKELEMEFHNSDITFMVLHFLEIKMQAWKDVWEMIAVKANDWLMNETTEEQRVFLKVAAEVTFE